MIARLALVVPAASRLAQRILDAKLPRMLAAGWDVHAIVPRAPARSRSDLRERIHEGDAAGCLARLRPQLVHFELSAGHAIPAAPARAIATFGGTDLLRSRIAMPEVHALHCFTEGEAREARARADIAELRVIAPVTHEVASTPVPAAAHGELRILVIAPLHWSQGLEVVLEAMSELVRSGSAAKLRLVGSGEALVPVGFARHQLALEPVVEMIRRDDGEDHLAWADVVLHLPVVDGVSPDLLEAQARGIPAVVSDAVGLPDLVAHDVTGLVVPRRSPKAAAEALSRLARDPVLRQRLAASARQRAATAFSPSTTVAAFDAWYREVLTGEPPARESRPRRA